MDIVNDIMRYENGELSAGETLKLFSELVRSGHVWHLQGSYGRMANELIKNGKLSESGELLAPVV